MLTRIKKIVEIYLTMWEMGRLRPPRPLWAILIAEDEGMVINLKTGEIERYEE